MDGRGGTLAKPIRVKLGRLLLWIFSVRWTATLLLILLLDICTFVAFRGAGGSQRLLSQDKLMHALAFLLLFIIGYIVLSRDFFPKIKKLSLPLLLVNGLIWLCYGVFIELGQQFLQYRDASLGDFVADLLGILLGLILVWQFNLHRQPGEDVAND